MTTVFFDVDTQLDFLFPAGALYVPGAEKILDTIARLNHHAAGRGNIVISTVDAHAENDAEFRQWPPHCVAGTIGQQKPAATLLEARAAVPNTAGAEIRLAGARQILLEKQALDCFTNLNLTRILTELAAGRYVVYGVVTEICVSFAALGLLETGKRVELVADAVRSLDDANAAKMLDEFRARGGIVTASAAVTAA